MVLKVILPEVLEVLEVAVAGMAPLVVQAIRQALLQARAIMAVAVLILIPIMEVEVVAEQQA